MSEYTIRDTEDYEDEIADLKEHVSNLEKHVDKLEQGTIIPELQKLVTSKEAHINTLLLQLEEERSLRETAQEKLDRVGEKAELYTKAYGGGMSKMDEERKKFAATEKERDRLANEMDNMIAWIKRGNVIKGLNTENTALKVENMRLRKELKIVREDSSMMCEQKNEEIAKLTNTLEQTDVYEPGRELEYLREEKDRLDKEVCSLYTKLNRALEREGKLKGVPKEERQDFDCDREVVQYVCVHRVSDHSRLKDKSKVGTRCGQNIQTTTPQLFCSAHRGSSASKANKAINGYFLRLSEEEKLDMVDAFDGTLPPADGAFPGKGWSKEWSEVAKYGEVEAKRPSLVKKNRHV